jgi:hypothetical protein
MADLEVTATGTAGSPSDYAATSGFTPTASYTDLIVTGDFSAGVITLQERNPVDLAWSNVWYSFKAGNAVIFTPNPAILYRFTTKNIVGEVNGFFGASSE